jgi:hypothetical protein
MHTNSRLLLSDILTLTDDIKLQESKWLFKCDRGQLPKSLMPIIKENIDRLRGQIFMVEIN